MPAYVLIGISSEGPTDNRFLSGIVKRTFDEIGSICSAQIETEIILLPILEKTNFVDWVTQSSHIGFSDFGINVLCIHADSDEETDQTAYNFKFYPAIQKLTETAEQDFCKVLVPVIPVQMIESWMLADKDLLKIEIGTDKDLGELGWNKHPESFSNPKKAIEDGIRIGWQHRSRRHRDQIGIGELYQPIGAKINLNKLRELPSYIKFEESVKTAFRELNLLHDN